MKILLFGANGQVGTELRELWEPRAIMPVGREQCDLRDPDAIRAVIRECSPSLILNAAAYTAVDRAETQVDDCFAINAGAPGVMAEEAQRLGALLVHYSTDYVFDGMKISPYEEEDVVNPQNQYGKSKLEGERAIEASNARYIVLRTSWVFSPQGTNFVKTMLKLAGERDRLQVVDDQFGSPTSAAAIARATARIVREHNTGNDASGLYHMSSEGDVSWCGFAREIFRLAELERVPMVEAIRTEDYPTAAKRPKNSRLSNDKFAMTFGFRLPHWRDQLAETLSVLHPGETRKLQGERP